MIKKLYFCESCRSSVEDVTTLQFVEENSDRGFCSEKCILNFYRPYMMEFENEEDSLRETLGFQHEDQYLDITSNTHYLNTVLTRPEEVWVFENELGQKFYTHILSINNSGEEIYFIVTCSYVDGSPAFVFYRTVTQFPELVNKYRREDSVEVDEVVSETFHDGQEDVDVPSEILKSLELKKSTMLANLLSVKKDNDIPFEEFPSYDPYLDETLESPDDVYEYEDDEGDVINTFIKSYCIDKLSFFFVVVTQQYKTEKDISIVPILGFPSTDNEIYTHFATGKKINETLKN
jgi:hypothetical protein